MKKCKNNKNFNNDGNFTNGTYYNNEYKKYIMQNIAKDADNLMYFRLYRKPGGREVGRARRHQ